MTKKHSKNNYSDNTLKTIAYIISTYVIGTYDLDIRDVLKSYIIALKRWESNHKETEILHQLEISNLLEQLKNN